MTAIIATIAYAAFALALFDAYRKKVSWKVQVLMTIVGIFSPYTVAILYYMARPFIRKKETVFKAEEGGQLCPKCGEDNPKNSPKCRHCDNHLSIKDT